MYLNNILFQQYYDNNFHNQKSKAFKRGQSCGTAGKTATCDAGRQRINQVSHGSSLNFLRVKPTALSICIVFFYHVKTEELANNGKN